MTESPITSLDDIAGQVPAGALVLRDMRMWHRGMPNRTQTIRTMLAVVYNRLFYHFERKLDIPGPVWEQMSEASREIFRYNSIVDRDAS